MLASCKHCAAFFVVMLFGVLRVDGQTAATKIDVAKLIRDVQLNSEAMSKRVFDYSWKSKTSVRQFKRARLQKELEQDHEVYPAPGLTFVVQKLVKENGLPLSAKRSAKEQKRVDSELLQAEIAQATFSNERTATADKTGCPTFGIWTVLNAVGGKETSLGISDFLCFASFSSPRIERKEGRDTVILLFRPRGGLGPLAKEKAPFAKLVGVLWIDLQDKVVTHVEAWPADNPLEFPAQSLASSPPTVVFEDMRLADGMWVRRSRYVDTRRDPLAFNGLALEWKQEFTNYQRYFTESKDYKIEEPKQPPPQRPPQR